MNQTGKLAGKLAARRIKVVAFDLNGTLVKWREAFDDSFKEAVEEWVGRWNGNEDEDIAGMALKRYYAQAEKWRRASREGEGRDRGRGGGRVKGEKNMQELRIEWMKDALKGLPLPAAQASPASMLERIRRLQTQNVKLAGGVKETLEQLSSRYQLAIISDTNKDTVLQVWERTGLRAYVKESHLFTPAPAPAAAAAAPAAKRKSGGELFRAASKALQVPPDRCVMVGDSWKRDVNGAAQAGWQAVWLHAPAKKPAPRQLADGSPVVRIRSFSELTRLLI